MGTIVNYRNGDPIARAGGSNVASLPGFAIYENTFDCAQRSLVVADIINPFLVIPAGSLVLGGVLDVLNPEAATTISVGDSTGPAMWLTANTTAVANGRYRFNGALMAAGTDTTAMRLPKLYTADDYLTLTLGGAAGTVLKVRVRIAVAGLG